MSDGDHATAGVKRPSSVEAEDLEDSKKHKDEEPPELRDPGKEN